MLAVTLLAAFLSAPAAAKPNFLFMREPWPPKPPCATLSSSQGVRCCCRWCWCWCRCWCCWCWCWCCWCCWCCCTWGRGSSTCCCCGGREHGLTPPARSGGRLGVGRRRRLRGDGPLQHVRHQHAHPEPRRPRCESPPRPPPSTTSHPRRRRTQRGTARSSRTSTRARPTAPRAGRRS